MHGIIMLRKWNCERPDPLLRVNLAGFSGALSHFACVRSRGTLFDLGEGVATRLEPELLRIRHVFLSHAHDDHLLGLRGLALARSVHWRNVDERLNVFVPAPAFDAVRGDLSDFAVRSGFDWELGIDLQPIAAGARILLYGFSDVEAFEADHLPGGASLGFRLLERRRRLQGRWRHLQSHEVAALRKRLPDEEVLEEFDVAEFVYSGDTPLCPASFAQGAKILWHESTFIADEDRDLETGRHALLEDVVRLARDCEAESLVLSHVSRRYRDEDVCAAIEATLREVGYDRPTFWLRGSYGLPVD